MTTKHDPIPLASKYVMEDEHWGALWVWLFGPECERYDRWSGEKVDASALRPFLRQAFEECPARYRDYLKLHLIFGPTKAAKMTEVTHGAVRDNAQRGVWAMHRILRSLANKDNPRVDDMALPVRVENGLQNAGYISPYLSQEEAWEKLRSATTADLLKIKNFGRKSLRQLDAALEEIGRPRFCTMKEQQSKTEKQPVRTLQEHTARKYVRSLLHHYSLNQIYDMLREETDRCPICDKGDCEMHKEKKHAGLLNA